MIWAYPVGEVQWDDVIYREVSLLNRGISKRAGVDKLPRSCEPVSGQAAVQQLNKENFIILPMYYLLFSPAYRSHEPAPNLEN